MQQQQQQHTDFSNLPTEVWARALYMLDVRDLARLHSAGGAIPAKDAFFEWRARRVLSESELAWFERTGVRLVLFEEVLLKNYTLFPNTTEHRRNGKLHRDHDLPALEFAVDGTQVWYQDGLIHRDNDRPARVSQLQREYFWQGKRHRPSGGPTIEYADGRRVWHWNNVMRGSSMTPDEEPQWYTPSGFISKKAAPKWAKWGAAAAEAAAAAETEAAAEAETRK